MKQVFNIIRRGVCLVNPAAAAQLPAGFTGSWRDMQLATAAERCVCDTLHIGLPTL